MRKGKDYENGVGAVQVIEMKLIEEPHVKVRTSFDAEKMSELVDSISMLGLLQPILLSPDGKKYEIIAGHRRFLACKRLKLKTIPAVVVGDPQASLDVMKLHENLVREDINVVDEAEFLDKIMTKKKLSQKMLAKLIGRTEGYVSQRLAVIEYPVELREAVQNGEIGFTVARELSRIDDLTTLVGYLVHAKQSGANSTVVKNWVEDYELQKKLAQGGEATSSPTALVGQSDVVSLPCAVCNEVKVITDTVMVRVCVECRGKLGV